MNLYIYGIETDFTDEQKKAIDKAFDQVVFVNTADYSLPAKDPEPKVLACDPDIVGWKLANEVIAEIPNLKAICLQTTGYEWVDGEFCAERGISVTNVPHYATNAVAEKCVLMALALAKKLSLFLREGGMNYAPEFVGEELLDKPTDIIGFGEIGHSLAQKLEPLVGRKEICYYSHSQDDPVFHYLPFEEMVEKSEYMFVTISKNPESIALFDDLSKFNRKMKVVVVANGFEEVTARLVEKCEAGELGGLAFESDDPKVLQREYRSNVFVTPPNAYYTREALGRLFQIWTDTMMSVAKGEVINRVN